MVLSAVAVSGSGTAFKLNEHPWLVKIIDQDRVEVSRGDSPLRIFYYGRSESGETYFCEPQTTSCTPVRGFKPDVREQSFSHLPL